MNRSSTRPSLLAFFVLVFVFAVPFWGLGAATGLQLLPGIPVAALAVVCPALAALIVAQRTKGTGGATALLKRAFDYQRIRSKIWYAPTLLLLPAANVLAFAVLRMTGTTVPAPRIVVLLTLLLCVGFFAGAVGEELA